jgi:hydrogenase expression/formation protein HypC
MCLAVPGKLISLSADEPMIRTGKVKFGGILKDINLALVPDVSIGDYLLVHAGVAIGIINKKEAETVFEYLSQIDFTEYS